MTAWLPCCHVIPSTASFSVFNLGVDAYCTVVESAGWICERLGLAPRFDFGGGDRGWIGDNPFIWLDTERIRSTGWVPTMTIREAVEAHRRLPGRQRLDPRPGRATGVSGMRA